MYFYEIINKVKNDLFGIITEKLKKNYYNKT